MQPDVARRVERVTWSEACRRYPNKWVVVVEMETASDSYNPFDTAVVVAHHDRRVDASPSVKAAFQTHDEVGSFWTGRISIWPATRIAMR